MAAIVAFTENSDRISGERRRRRWRDSLNVIYAVFGGQFSWLNSAFTAAWKLLEQPVWCHVPQLPDVLVIVIQ